MADLRSVFSHDAPGCDGRPGALHGDIRRNHFTSDEAQELIGYTEVRPILLWHALEECEHKAVAFDVSRDGRWKRTHQGLGMRIASLPLFSELVIQTTRSLAGDRAAYNLVRVAAAFEPSGITRYSAQQQLSAFVPLPAADFIPTTGTAQKILERWTKELFDADGGQQARSSV